jgi:hypothetical protein
VPANAPTVAHARQRKTGHRLHVREFLGQLTIARSAQSFAAFFLDSGRPTLFWAPPVPPPQGPPDTLEIAVHDARQANADCQGLRAKGGGEIFWFSFPFSDLYVKVY